MQRLILRAIEWYQVGREGRPSPCRFTPSCSHYAHEAVSVHGAGRGTWLAARRLMRCRPFGPSGFDPVPESRRPHGDDQTTSSSSVSSTLVNTGRAH